MRKRPLGHSVPVYENMHTSLQTDRKRATQNEKYAHMQMFPGTLRAGISSSTPLEAQNTEDREKGGWTKDHNIYIAFYI